MVARVRGESRPFRSPGTTTTVGAGGVVLFVRLVAAWQGHDLRGEADGWGKNARLERLLGQAQSARAADVVPRFRGLCCFCDGRGELFLGAVVEASEVPRAGLLDRDRWWSWPTEACGRPAAVGCGDGGCVLGVGIWTDAALGGGGGVGGAPAGDAVFDGDFWHGGVHEVGDAAVDCAGGGGGVVAGEVGEIERADGCFVDVEDPGEEHAAFEDSVSLPSLIATALCFG